MRTRPLKPSICKNETIAECGPWAILLLERMWLMADRKGRLEYRPKKIWAEGFPYHDPKDVNVEGNLDILASKGIVTIYTVHGKRFIEIPNFEKHARPHPHEPSEFPGPEESDPVMPKSDPAETKSELVMTNSGEAVTCQNEQKNILSECASLPFPSFPSPLSPFPESGGKPASPENFKLTPQGLAQEFVFYSRRTRSGVKADKEIDAVPVMEALIGAGIPPDKILAEIHAVRRQGHRQGQSGRDPTEYLWQFKNRLLAEPAAKYANAPTREELERRALKQREYAERIAAGL